MPLPARHWADLSTADFAALQASGQIAHTIAVLPLGATEQHGPHLPLAVDTLLADGIIRACLPHLGTEVPVLFLPTLPIGLSPEHAAFAGTLTLKAETVLRLWTDVAESVAATGIQKLLLFNAHGGHVGAMDLVGRDLRARLGLLVYAVSWFNLPLQDEAGCDVLAQVSAQEQRFGVHAGQAETAMMLALAPQQVTMSVAQNFESAAQRRASDFAILGNGRSAKLAWQTQDYNASGAVGNAAAATPALGHALVDAAGRALARLLAEVHRLPADTLRTTHGD